MKPLNLILRCYIVRRAGQWEAFCIDLCLAAQADTQQAARAKLEAQIASYVEEALTIDREYAEQLLTRKAPLKQRITYHVFRVLANVSALKSRIGRVFSESLPVHVGPDCHA